MKPAKHPRLGALLSVLALIGQLLLPMSHAQSWAARNGDPLLYAFCGEVSPTLVARMQLALPAEVLAGLQKRDHALPSDLSCSLCASMHGGNLLGSAAPQLMMAGFAGPPVQAERPLAPPPVRHSWPPPLRGPPSLLS